MSLEDAMLAITCDKCRRRSTLTTEEIRAALADSQGKKHAQILCPYCGKHIKIAPERLEHAVRLAPPVEPSPAPDTE
jgi:RNase P subunit RPR2